jgi:hypothetical protein
MAATVPYRYDWRINRRGPAGAGPAHLQAFPTEAFPTAAVFSDLAGGESAVE